MTSNITPSWVLALLPEIGLIILLVIVTFYARALPKSQRRQVGIVTAWGAFAVLVVTVGQWLILGEPSASAPLLDSLVWGGMIRHDLVTLVFRLMFLTALVITSLISLDVERLQEGEYYALLIIATIGFSLMSASVDLIMVYLALETASVSSYILAGFVTKDSRSAEAGMKYFVYGAFATGVMLYGMSLIYGMTGATSYFDIARALAQGGVFAQPGVVQPTPESFSAGVLLAAAMIIVGFGFKISSVPFHFWTPDVYEGSPTPFTAFVSTASKAAGFAIFLRLFQAGALGAPTPGSGWWAMLVAMAIVTMTLGNFAAIFQNNIKRLIAYSSIAQAGYALIGLVSLSPEGSSATMYYLLMYVFTNVAIFGGVVLVSNLTGSERLEDFNGLSRRSPYLALVMLFALLSLGGIPPTAGFVGKFFLFKAAIEAGFWWLALIGILNAFVALYYYLSVAKYMYLYRSDQEDVAIPVSRGAQIGLAISTAAIILLGVIPGPMFDLTRQAAEFLFLSG